MNPQTASYILTDWKPLYQGIEYASGVASYPLGVPLPNPPKSRIQHVNVLRITLSAPGISFFTNPKQGNLHTVRRTITQFLTDYPDVRVAINANFACHDSKSDCSMDCFLFGLAISKGDIVCDPTKPVAEPKNAPPCLPAPSHGWQALADVPDESYVGAAALLITQDNQVSIQEVTTANPIDTSSFYTAVAGSHNPGQSGPNDDWPL